MDVSRRAVAVPRVRGRNPLAPLTYLWRNAGKTGPLTLVIVLAVSLVAGIIAMINSIPLSIRTTYAYSARFTGVTPRGDAAGTMPILQEIKEKSPVPIERVVVCRTTGTVIQSLVGKWPFFVIGLTPPDMAYYLRLQGSRGITGRLPDPGAAEAVVSESVARNLDLKLGSELLGPQREEGFSPQSVKVVGIARTPQWVMVCPIDYLRAYHFPPVDLGIVVAQDPSRQEELDRWADKHFKGRRAAILAYHQIERNTSQMFQTLYTILNVVIGTLVLVITFMMGMLINIYQSQRTQEFGLLQAIGFTRGQILARVLAETVIVVVLGWLLGVVAAFGLLNVANKILMEPRAFAIDTLDVAAYRYTLPLPLAILAVATVATWLRFRRFDPIGVVERRIV